MLNKKIKRTILVFYPHNPFDPLHGSHLRCLQQLKDLRAEFSVILASSSNTSDTEWPIQSAELSHLSRCHGLRSIAIFERSFLGHLSKFITILLYRLRSLLRWSPLGFISVQLQQALFVTWFKSLDFRYKPAATIIHYTHWAYLSSFSRGLRVLELHDLLPVNRYLSARVTESIEQRFGVNPFCPMPTYGYIEHIKELPSAIVDEVVDVVNTLNGYDLVWMISSREERILREAGLHTNSHTIYPVLASVQPRVATASQPPILPIGPNPFNTYALLNFIDNVLPLLESHLPSEYEIHVTGRFWRDMSISLPYPLRYCGLVANYHERLASSSFMIAPTFTGTGQQVKIFEALAAGVPIVAYKNSVPCDVLESNPSIIPANSADEFAFAIQSLASSSDSLRYYQDLAASCRENHLQNCKQLPYTQSLQHALR